MKFRAIHLSSPGRMNEIRDQYGLFLPAHLLRQNLIEISETDLLENEWFRNRIGNKLAVFNVRQSEVNHNFYLNFSDFADKPKSIADALGKMDDAPPSVLRLFKATSNFYDSPVIPSWKIRNKVLDFNKRPLIMGILNVTPDSFSDGGQFYHPESAVDRALQMIDEGADIIDIGGESTRPGSEPVTEDEEIRRVIPIIEKIRAKTDVIISIDTYKSGLARLALEAGCDIVNDISGCQFDSGMPEVIARFDCPLIVMHIKGTPRNMQKNPQYSDIMLELYRYFEERIETLNRFGLSKLMVDPGIGFGKRLSDNIRILRDLRDFKFLGYPVLIGTSRKSFIGALTDKQVEKRLSGSIATQIIAAMNGADIVRVHDVGETRDAIKIFKATEDVPGDQI